MSKFQYLKTIFGLVFLTVLTSCQTVRNASNMDRVNGVLEAQKKKEDAWIKQQRLAQASPEEVAVAQAGAVRFVGTKASIPDRSLSVIFKIGTSIPVRGIGVSNLFTTTSFYELKNTRTGKSLVKTASTIAIGQHGFEQKVLVSQDGTRLLIHETWCGGDGAHDTYALVTKVSDYDVWDVKYLKLPEFTGFDGIPEHGPSPVGFAGDFLIFDPLFSGKTFKMKLTEIEEAKNPLPFTVG